MGVELANIQESGWGNVGELLVGNGEQVDEVAGCGSVTSDGDITGLHLPSRLCKSTLM